MQFATNHLLSLKKLASKPTNPWRIHLSSHPTSCKPSRSARGSSSSRRMSHFKVWNDFGKKLPKNLAQIWPIVALSSRPSAVQEEVPIHLSSIVLLSKPAFATTKLHEAILNFRWNLSKKKKSPHPSRSGQHCLVQRRRFHQSSSQILLCQECSKLSNGWIFGRI